MTVKVGIIGMGFMGRMHLSAYLKLPQVKVVAFADIDADKRAGNMAGAGNLGDTGFQSDVESFDRVYDCGFKLIEDPEIDLVDICVPTCDHKDLFVAAVKADKNVSVGETDGGRAGRCSGDCRCRQDGQASRHDCPVYSLLAGIRAAEGTCAVEEAREV